MERDIASVSIEQFREIIDILNPCMDDYLYIMDIQNDYYCISPNAVERFMLPDSQFHQVSDYLAKLTYPEDMPNLLMALDQIENHGKLFHNLQYRWMGREGKPIWINCRGRVLLDDASRPALLVGCINEIGTKQKADNISGLLREASLQKELGTYALEGNEGYLIRLGIDNFKEINENKGMEYGDMVLGKTAECIQAVLLPEQKLYRIVADEYVIIDFEKHHIEEIVELYKNIQSKITQFIEEKCYEVFYTISAGVLELSRVYNHDYHNLMKLSEFALNEAKNTGKNTGKNKYYIFDENDYNGFLHKRELTAFLLQAVNNDFEGFEAYFQPIMNIGENKIRNAETLLRFKTEKTGMISPVEFIPLLEESNLIIPVGKWVLDQAMQMCARIRKIVPDFQISVNLSYIQVLKSNVLSEILTGIDKYKLSMDSIIVELTESGFLESNSYFIDFCEGLKSYGIPLALDDFGTGYSNFHYLYNLNLSTIKIDRSFTLKALNNSYEHNLLQHMADMVHDIDLKICIEGIETKEELDRICEIGPDYIQGYYFGRPSPVAQFMEQFFPEHI